MNAPFIAPWAAEGGVHRSGGRRYPQARPALHRSGPGLAARVRAPEAALMMINARGEFDAYAHPDGLPRVLSRT
jgi:hypothetical protein